MTAGSTSLPENTVLLHIGAYKTGTTAIQGAFFQARPQLAEHGVLHAGAGRQPWEAALALTGVRLRGQPTPRIEQWHRLVDQVAAASDKRVIVSSEFFGNADVATARRAVKELGGPRVHVVVTLRPLARIMPSQWQQYVRTGATKASYGAWLKGTLKQAQHSKPTPSFWRRHSHDVLVERWASVVGPENVTVIVLDEADRSFLLRTFEQLLGLPPGLLVAWSSTENRSLTLGEIELVRQVSIEFRRRGWSDELFKQIVRYGFAAQLQTNRTPQADEPRITTPQWALDRAAEIGGDAADKLSVLGVRIVGDISTLGAPVLAEEPHEAARAGLVLPVDAAREAVVGTLLSGGITTMKRIDVTSSRELLRVVLGRLWRRALSRSDSPERPPTPMQLAIARNAEGNRPDMSIDDVEAT